MMANYTAEISADNTTKMEYKPTYEFYSILNSDSALDVSADYLKSAIINLIIANTAENKNISADEITPMTEYLNKMLRPGTTIEIAKYNRHETMMVEVSYINRVQIYNLYKLLTFVIESRCWIQHEKEHAFYYRNKELREDFGISFERLEGLI